MHGVSVEYDVSVEYGGCYKVVVAGAPKEQQLKKNAYLKIAARLITHIIPLYNRMGLTTHALTEISDLGNLYVV